MTAARRWWTIALGVVLLVSTPVVVRLLPASDAAVTSSTLLARVRASRDVPFSGYSESAGHVALPANDVLSSLSTLLGTTSRVRVWWQSPALWRTSTVRTTGETDLFHRGHQTVRWVYESKTATRYPDVRVHLPTANDLLPNELARRVLAGARPAELRRIGARRVAGRDALGLRLTPADEQAAVARVDVWVDRTSGVPLQVDVLARGSGNPVLTSRFLDFSLGRPARDDLAFVPPHDARLHDDSVVDIASAADRFAFRVPPTSLAGLPAHGRALGSVGVYGRGPTVLIAIPLWERTAKRVRESLRRQPGAGDLDQGLLISAEPLRLLLAHPEHNDTSWLLAGTVTQQALVDAADELARHHPALRMR